MNQAVIIKSEKSGIHLILDEERPFSELLEEIILKFKESEKFFKNAKVAISFGGRKLSEEEENAIVNTIMEHTSIKILCILDHDAVVDEVIRRRTQELLQPVIAKKPKKVHNNKSNVYRGSLKENQVLESKENLLILGDVPESATVISYGDVIVLGTLAGNVQAGAEEEAKACIAASHFAPGKLMIGSLCYEREQKGGLFSRKSKNKTPEAKVAFVSEGIIHIEPLEEYSFV